MSSDLHRPPLNSYTPHYTDAQRKAITTLDRNLVVTAGAGSGKTRVLVEHFIALLDAHPDWTLPSLVAITFTEKAAREMRDRVRQAIEERIVQATQAGNEPEIHHWRTHQAALDSARIGTIHSLCATILRANAAEVGIDPAFEVLDEIDAAILRAAAVERALAEPVALDSPMGLLLRTVNVSTISEVLRAQIGLPDDQLEGDDAAFSAELYGLWETYYERYISAAVAALRVDPGFVEAVNWSLPAALPDSDLMVQNWLLIAQGCLLLFDPAATVQDCLAVLKQWAGEINLRGGSAKVWGGKDILEAAKAYAKLIREKAQTVATAIPPIGPLDQQALTLLAGWQAALRSAKSRYADLKSHHLLDFDDLEALTRHLLKRFPDVAARYRGTEFKHILVDEFQDTNGAQLEIVTALADLDQPGSLFVVGDPRQSIYGFRGAEVWGFERVSRQIASRGGEMVVLSESFRTHTRLVNAFNGVFARLMQTQPDDPFVQMFAESDLHYAVEYGAAMQAGRPSAESPCLEFLLLDKAPESKQTADDLRRYEAARLAQRLRELREGELPVWDKAARQHRPMDYGDVAILFQSSASMAHVEEAFKEAGLPYVTVAGKGYFSRPEVWDLLNLLRALYNPADDLALASALRSPLYNLSDNDLLALRWQRAESDPQTEHAARLPLWIAVTDTPRTYDPALPNPESVAFARQSLRRLHALAGRVTIAELLVRALQETAFLATLSGLPDGERRCGNVEKMIEVARRSGRIALGEFTLYLQDLTEREARESEALVAAQDAVQLMTVHASKGLEFPIVALFDASWGNISYDPPLLIDPVLGAVCSVTDEDGGEPFSYWLACQFRHERDAAERTRLLYVAMTRAQDYVLVSGQINGRGRWLKQLIEVLGLPTSSDSGEPQLVEWDWGSCLVHCETPPVESAPRSVSRESVAGSSAWDGLTLDPIPNVEPRRPPLLAAVPFDRHAAARALKATEIAVYGESNAAGRPDKFRSYVLRDAPSSIREVAGKLPIPNVPRRVIGEIVHRALRWNHLPGNTPDLEKILGNYAWEQGLTDVQMIHEAVKMASDLLQRTEISDVIKLLNSAQRVYRELPFTYHFDQRTINGVIDVLCFDRFGKWHLVDYKTSAVPANPERQRGERIREHAQRYHPQVGIYAAAVEELTGQAPEVHIHYVRYVYTVRVPEAIWRGVLQTLDDDITQALQD